jgi:hypothetical protein
MPDQDESLMPNSNQEFESQLQSGFDEFNMYKRLFEIKAIIEVSRCSSSTNSFTIKDATPMGLVIRNS